MLVESKQLYAKLMCDHFYCSLSLSFALSSSFPRYSHIYSISRGLSLPSRSLRNFSWSKYSV